MKVGLGLGGGGARGLVHVGILKVLHAHKIPITVIAGTSAGAIEGAMFAATQDPEWIEDRFKKFFSHDLFSGAHRAARATTRGLFRSRGQSISSQQLLDAMNYDGASMILPEYVQQWMEIDRLMTQNQSQVRFSVVY